MNHVSPIIKKGKGISIDTCCNKAIGKIEGERNKKGIGGKIIFSGFNISHKEIYTARKNNTQKKGERTMKKDNKASTCATEKIHQRKKE